MPSISDDIAALASDAHKPVVFNIRLREVLERMNYNDKYNMSAPPTPVDDIEAGYKVGTRWTTTANSLFICTSNTLGAATWILIFGSGD